jgi:hypothetical protein
MMNNEQAFPNCEVVRDENTGAVTAIGMKVGLTLQDWFAGQAMIGLLADTDGVEMPPGVMSVYQLVAEAAYRYADAMLAAREKGGKK